MTDSWLIRTIRAHRAEYDAWRAARHPSPQIGQQSSRNGSLAPVSSSVGLPETMEEDSRLSPFALETTEIDTDELADRIARTTKPLRIDGRGDGLSDGVALQSASHPTTSDDLLTIISRSIGRTTGIANHTERAKDVLESIRNANLAVPQPSKVVDYQNPCAKIFTHKWLDPQCVENGCQSIALWAKHNSAVTTGERAYLDGVRDGLEQAKAFAERRMSILLATSLNEKIGTEAQSEAYLFRHEAQLIALKIQSAIDDTRS